MHQPIQPAVRWLATAVALAAIESGLIAGLWRHAPSPAPAPATDLRRAAAALPAGAAAARPPRLPEYAPPVVDYRIHARLDAATKRIRATQRLTWRNPSRDLVPDLWFHLYLNAFRNTQSTFFRESGGQLRGDRMPEGGWGWIDVASLRLADGADLTSAITFEAPDDGNTEDRTVIRVPLPDPVPPGGSVTLDIEFQSVLPRVFARTGYRDDFILAGQWFPKIAVYEPAGTRGRNAGGWNCHQFHANSEFYADFGRFDVTLTLPSGFVVGATGELMERRDEDGTSTYRYVQEDVHDFAWTADPDYVEQRHRFSASEDVTPQEYRQVATLLDRTRDEVMLSDVEIVLLLQPLHLPQARRYLDAAKLAIKWFGLWYGRYPYRTLTVVDPAPGAIGAGGMEYPTFITGGTSFLLNRWPLHEVRLVEEVTVHEFGHQFWYGLVASNEFEEAWLDEGLTSYSTAKVMEAAYGRDQAIARLFELRVGPTDVARLSNSPARRYDAVRQPSWTYQAGAYGFYSYQKPELLLRTLENHLGEAIFARIMRTYHERWRFGHPASDDFYAVANEVSGQDLTWFFAQAVEGTQVLDYEVASVASRPVRRPAGRLDDSPSREVVRKAAARGHDAGNGPAGGPHETVVVVRRRGDFVFPVEIGLKFEGAALERLYWDGRDRSKKLTLVRPGKLEWASVDPDRKVLLDVDWMNNARRLEPNRLVPAAWTSRWLFWMQQLAASLAW